MMKSCLSFLLAAQAIICLSAQAQHVVQPDSLGLPGDNLNLYAVLKVFQESPTLEDFEKKLNAEESKINNLDLNGDEKIDYIRVVDNAVDNVHAIVLQVPVSKSESQDVAVIQVTRDAEDRVQVQVIGDEELYGKDYIVEPNYDQAAEKGEGTTPGPSSGGTTSDTTLSFDGKTVVVNKTTTVEVAAWPVIRYIYVPTYRAWRSPWSYAYYPRWWRPRAPFFWHYYWGFHYRYYHNYFAHYRRWYGYRNHIGYTHYARTLRSTSTFVTERRRTGVYRRTYSRPDLRQEGLARYREGRGRGPGAGTAVRDGRKPGIRKPGGGKPSMDKPTGIRSPRPGASRPGAISPGVRKPGAPAGGKHGAERPRAGRPGGGR